MVAAWMDDRECRIARQLLPGAQVGAHLVYTSCSREEAEVYARDKVRHLEPHLHLRLRADESIYTPHTRTEKNPALSRAVSLSSTALYSLPMYVSANASQPFSLILLQA